MSWAKRWWFGLSSIPAAVMVNNAIFGVSVIDSHNGGAVSEALGPELPPYSVVLLARKSWTFRLAPFQPGDNVIVKCAKFPQFAM